MLSDEELVERCNSADGATAERAFNLLYERHKAFVLRVVAGIVNDNALALDAMQETFTFLLRQFPPTGDGLTLTAKLTTYLYPIAKNSAISQLRKAKRLPDGDFVPDDLAAAEPADSDDLLVVLRELPAERREVVTLRFIHDFSITDIAEALDVPVGTVKLRLHLAIRQLRKSTKVKHFFDS
ncbi:MAG: RNA polymerase sigma factor [Woeseiaceae bacterium]